ncbi:Glucoamylase (glucan-1,4-alpha-glucosidase), GH15 family [Enhydrobacter aerosaccus]|uniref:Trehalase n=1 Tax=Enhydrobacter aerosaccus TaxID=225324 RepID=A0A1T4KPP0_9HYPH|nr:glycoside hydrolase family 15 protein [Enhydrobacter aerosaccus]SJZ44380.1 Glucoamylase (glucan-1,4-alpha-glucosidase), GH15 family [Enhydrobacter aerosaccus]
MSAPIESYGMVGDCQTAALIGKNGSVDWLCWPRFDSDACFAALLGGQSNGFWLISPHDDVKAIRRRYRPDTLILETEFETESGRVTLIDFMLPRGPSSDLIRIVRGDEGEVTVCMELMLRFGYGTTTPWVTRLEGGALRAVAGPDMVVLRTPAHVRGENFKTLAQFSVTRGKSMPFVLSYGPSHLPLPAPVDPYESLSKCEKFWCDWTAKTKTDGVHAEAIKRSLITLKGLTFLPSGGIVAAPTTSLPEQFGSERNWDYRLCWLRDATLTLLAMMNAGIYDEAAAWRDWLQRAVAGSPAEMQIMYGLRGERRLTEWIADWLPGYANSQPVRIGNAAHQQFQLDVYGELMDAFEQSRKGGLAATEEGWELQRSLISHVAKVWRHPDNGIWETRGPQRHFVHSKVMAWVAFDRAIKGVETHGLKGPVEQWRAIRDEIKAEVCDKGFDSKRNTFRASYDGDLLDASLLLMAQTGFLKSGDPRFIGTVEAIERDLMRDGFVMRYNTHDANDGLRPGEGAFLACSFWLADAYISIGRHADAEALFNRLLAIRNDLGLLAEEYDPHYKRLQGNFPQAFSHIALINTAFNLTRFHKPSEQRASSHDVQTSPEKPDPKKVEAPPDFNHQASSSRSR